MLLLLLMAVAANCQYLNGTQTLLTPGSTKTNHTLIYTVSQAYASSCSNNSNSIMSGLLVNWFNKSASDCVFSSVNLTHTIHDPLPKTNTTNCATDPCKNSATCTNDTIHGFICTCTSGRFGPTCHTTTNGCASSPCGNNGICKATDAGTASCECSDGYTGTFCNITINPISTGISTYVTSSQPKTFQTFTTILRFYADDKCSPTKYVGGVLVQEETCGFIRDSLSVYYTKTTSASVTLKYRMSLNGFKSEFEDEGVISAFRYLECLHTMTEVTLPSKNCTSTAMRLYPQDTTQLYVVANTNPAGWLYNDALVYASTIDYTEPVGATTQSPDDDKQNEDADYMTEAPVYLTLGSILSLGGAVAMTTILSM